VNVLPEKFESTLEYAKTTKTTYRFQEIQGENIKTLYIKQVAFKIQPKKIKVTVEVLE